MIAILFAISTSTLKRLNFKLRNQYDDPKAAILEEGCEPEQFAEERGEITEEEMWEQFGKCCAENKGTEAYAYCQEVEDECAKITGGSCPKDWDDDCAEAKKVCDTICKGKPGWSYCGLAGWLIAVIVVVVVLVVAAVVCVLVYFLWWKPKKEKEEKVEDGKEKGHEEGQPPVSGAPPSYADQQPSYADQQQPYPGAPQGPPGADPNQPGYGNQAPPPQGAPQPYY
jgi:uncharacterized membrane protein